MTNTNLLEPLSPLVEQATIDLAECLDCSWALALRWLDSGVAPLCTIGRNPHMDKCIACAKMMVHTQAGNTLVAPKCLDAEDWAPRVIRPILWNNEIAAVLIFGRKRTRAAYTAEDHALIEGFATHLTFLLSHDRLAAKAGHELARLQRTKIELDSAREVHQRFLPCHLTPVKGLDYYGESQPAGEVGGDFYDFVTDDQSSLLLSIGDVSGKGVPSAIIMAGVQASLRALAWSGGRLSSLVRKLNGLVWQLAPDNFYATMFYARIDGVSREMHYVNAGHDRAMLVRERSNRAVTLESTGSVLGLSTRTAFEERTIQLQPGDTLVAVTDGISDAADSEGAALDDVVLDAVRSHPHESSSELAHHIIRSVDILTHGGVPPDDRTVVVVRFLRELKEAALRFPVEQFSGAYAEAV